MATDKALRDKAGCIVLEWFVRRVTAWRGAVRGATPSSMSDEYLQQTIHDVGGRLLNNLAPLVQVTFAVDAATEAVPFVQSVPTSVRGHVLMLFMSAYDSFGLVLRSLNYQAHSAALGPIRSMAETLALEKWLLESDDPNVRLGRACRLIVDAAEQYQVQRQVLDRVVAESSQRRVLSGLLLDGEQKLRVAASDLAARSNIQIAESHGTASRLMERFLPEHGGYLLYSLLSSAGVHAGALRNKFFYGQPDKGILDFDFKGMFVARGYWTGTAISLYLELCDLVAPILGWGNWHSLSNTTHNELGPLVQEVEKRFFRPFVGVAPGLMPVQSAPSS